MPQFPPKVPVTPEVGNPSDRVILCGFGPFGDMASSVSNHCAKVEVYLRLQGIDYDAQSAFPTSAPKGKLPYIKHGPNIIGDSSLIIKYLNNTYKDSLKYPPTNDPEKLMLATAVKRITENHLQWVTGYYLFLTDEGFEHVSSQMFKGIPWPLSTWLSSSVRKAQLESLKSKGIADHHEEDFTPMLEEDVDALVYILGDKQFVTGDTPSDADAILFAVLDHIVHDVVDYKLRKYVKSKPSLVDYVNRIRADYFSQPSKFRG